MTRIDRGQVRREVLVGDLDQRGSRLAVSSSMAATAATGSPMKRTLSKARNGVSWTVSPWI